jgi:hypothetical protein
MRVLANNPGAAGSGNEREAADRAVHRRAILLAKMRHEHDRQPPLGRQLRERAANFRIGVFHRPAQIRADRVDDHQPAVFQPVDHLAELREVAPQLEQAATVAFVTPAM